MDDFFDRTYRQVYQILHPTQWMTFLIGLTVKSVKLSIQRVGKFGRVIR